MFTYKTTTFNTLVDSPLIAGKYFEKFDLDPGGPARVTLDVIADRPDELEMTPEQIAPHRDGAPFELGKTPSKPNMARPDGVLVSRPCT